MTISNNMVSLMQAESEYLKESGWKPELLREKNRKPIRVWTRNGRVLNHFQAVLAQKHLDYYEWDQLDVIAGELLPDDKRK